MMDRLTIANMKNDTGALDEVEKLLLEVKEGFDEAAGKESNGLSAPTKSVEPRTEGGISLAA